MIKLNINQREVETKPGTMLLTAVNQSGIAVPTLCYLEGYPCFASCMLCVVKEVKTNKLLPSCSMPVADGMIIETDSEEVHEARRSALELLMSDHVGDCLGPCQRTCPAHMNIPLMNMHIEAERMHDALVTAKEHIALPAALGRICSAPCENACRRKHVDNSLGICTLKCFVADQDLASEQPYLPLCKSTTGKKIAIIGSGPAGLSAAYYLLQEGHACTIFDKNTEPGGMLRYGVPNDVLPDTVLDAEIEIIQKLGVKLEMSQQVGKQLSFAELKQDYDAVILAAGELPAEELKKFSVDASAKGVLINTATFETNVKGIFAGGGIVHPGRMAVRSVAHGRSIALAVNHYLLDQVLPLLNNRSQSRVGKMKDGELEKFVQIMDNMKHSSFAKEEIDRESIAGHNISTAQAIAESSRCAQCGCVSFNNCKLRIYSEQYQANSQRYKGEERKNLTRILDHPFVIYEPGKCIKCGLCIRISEKAGEQLGLTFIGRGFDVQVAVPLNESLEKGLEKTATECVEACPSGALLFKDMMLRKSEQHAQ